MAFPNGYFRFSFRDFVIAIVSRETWWFIGVVGCCGFVVFESGWCFTRNIGFALRRPKDVNVFHVKRSRMVELSGGGVSRGTSLLPIFMAVHGDG